jgi:hypothetical protein
MQDDHDLIACRPGKGECVHVADRVDLALDELAVLDSHRDGVQAIAGMTPVG